MGKRSTSFEGFDLMLKMIAMGIFPKSLTKLLGIRFFGESQSKFYNNLVHGTIKHRAKEGIIRPDMIHLLMEARKGSLRNEHERDNEGFATVEEVSSDQLKGGQKRVWDDDDLTAQCFLFFLAGFDTSSTLLCFTAHELTVNQDVQAKLREEVDAVNSDLNGKPLSYDVLQKMKYLDMVVSGQ